MEFLQYIIFAMELFVLLEEILSVKDELRYATMECGGLYVIRDGLILMLLLYAGSWVFKEKVSRQSCTVLLLYIIIKTTRYYV